MSDSKALALRSHATQNAIHMQELEDVQFNNCFFIILGEHILQVLNKAWEWFRFPLFLFNADHQRIPNNKLLISLFLDLTPPSFLFRGEMMWKAIWVTEDPNKSCVWAQTRILANNVTTALRDNLGAFASFSDFRSTIYCAVGSFRPPPTAKCNQVVFPI